ncbi:uncharacterized protein VICG_00314 [Vittaforma corneae ATCC 50505]|uniref:Uncharacterized protein n=1 Tax=Vittaforma corneae (strain ATCC 50505) TaxID=993615 RepID=L2GQF7_VITCO|nr:uncharacterized protein VICG_00314 [Vittaforma corneae ATCC 50505]ELA42562.1 hypothetical protein VICG_00314 [Vittaforma corneae ATCC 50505]
MISKSSIAGIAAVLLVAVFFLCKFAFGNADNFILESPEGYDDFSKRLEQYGFSKLVESSVESLQDEEIKAAYSQHKEAVKSIILIDLFVGLKQESSARTFYNTKLPDLTVGAAPEPTKESKTKHTTSSPPAAESELQEALKSFICLCMQRFAFANVSIMWSNDLLFTQPKIEIVGFKLGFVPSEALAAFKEMVSLDLKQTHVTKGFESLKILKNLRYLTLSENGITEFPNFTGFPALNEVYLNNNAIQKIDLSQYLKSGTDEYEKLGITNLHLNNNKISNIDNDFMKVFPELKELSLRNNKIAKMPECFNGLEDKVKVDITTLPSTG